MKGALELSLQKKTKTWPCCLLFRLTMALYLYCLLSCESIVIQTSLTKIQICKPFKPLDFNTGHDHEGIAFFYWHWIFWQLLSTNFALSGFPVSRWSHEQVTCSLSMLRRFHGSLGPFLGLFFNKWMFIPWEDIVINDLAWQTFCKGLGFLGLCYQSNYSKVFFPLSIMQCWISDV